MSVSSDASCSAAPPRYASRTDALVACHRLEVPLDDNMPLVEDGHTVAHVRNDAHVVLNNYERRSAVVERL